MKLTQKQQQIQSKINKKAAKFNPNLNKQNVKTWLSSEGIEVPPVHMEIILRIVRSYLHKHFVRGDKATKFKFGVGVDEDFDISKLIGKVKRSIKRHERINSGKNSDTSQETLEDLRNKYREKFGIKPSLDVTAGWLRNAIRGAFSTKSFPRREKKKIEDYMYFGMGLTRKERREQRAAQRDLSGRVPGCILDEQAKKLGIYDKEYIMHIKDETGNKVPVKVPYPELPRTKRKRLNHKAYKSAA